MTTSEYQVLRAREPASFSRENVITVVILLRLAKMSQSETSYQRYKSYNYNLTERERGRNLLQ